LVWNGTANTVKGYLNGAVVFDEPQLIWPTGFPAVTLGSGYNAELERQWKGNIDEVSIWNKALDADEIRVLYATGLYQTERKAAVLKVSG
jgi:hypothetical protein